MNILISVCSRCKIQYSTRSAQAGGVSHGYCRYHTLDELVRHGLETDQEAQEHRFMGSTISKLSQAVVMAEEEFKHSVLLLIHSNSERTPMEHKVLACHFTQEKARRAWGDAHS